MKFLLTILIVSICFVSYGQEDNLSSIAIEWEELSAPLSFEKSEFEITKYQLLEVNLNIDLRRQSLRKSYTMLMDSPKYKDVSSIYTVKSPKSKSSGFTISGNGSNFNTTNSSIKNNAYRDAGIYLYNNHYNPYNTTNRRNTIFIY